MGAKTVQHTQAVTGISPVQKDIAGRSGQLGRLTMFKKATRFEMESGVNEDEGYGNGYQCWWGI